MEKLTEIIQNFQDAFAEKLLEFMNGRSCSQFSKDIGLPRTTVTQWLKKKGQPRIEYLILLAKKFNCSVEYLIGLED